MSQVGAGRGPDELLARRADEPRPPEARLQEREQQYRAIFEATSDGLIINDLDSGIIVEANPAACRMHGYTYEEFVGQHPGGIIHPDDHAAFADFLQIVRDGGQFRGRARDVR